MSYWVYLEDEGGELVEVDAHAEGGTYAIGGTPDAELNVTYNYSRHFSVREIDGKTGAESAPILRAAVERLGTDRDSDYWAATEGNAGYMASILLGWAEQHPSARWRVS